MTTIRFEKSINGDSLEIFLNDHHVGGVYDNLENIIRKIAKILKIDIEEKISEPETAFERHTFLGGKEIENKPIRGWLETV